MDNFDEHGHCNMEDLIILTCHVTSRDHMLKGFGAFSQ